MALLTGGFMNSVQTQAGGKISKSDINGTQSLYKGYQTCDRSILWPLLPFQSYFVTAQ